MKILNWLLIKALKLDNIDKFITIDKAGEIWVAGEKQTLQELNFMKQDVEVIQQMETFKTITNTLKKEAQEKIFNSGVTINEIMLSRVQLYVVGRIEAYMKAIVDKHGMAKEIYELNEKQKNLIQTPRQ